MIKYRKFREVKGGHITERGIIHYSGILNEKHIASEIEQRSGIPKIRTMNVLSELGKLITESIMDGKIISIEGFGSFRPGIVLDQEGKPILKKVTFMAQKQVKESFSKTEFEEEK